MVKLPKNLKVKEIPKFVELLESKLYENMPKVGDTFQASYYAGNYDSYDPDKSYEIIAEKDLPHEWYLEGYDRKFTNPLWKIFWTFTRDISFFLPPNNQTREDYLDENIKPAKKLLYVKPIDKSLVFAAILYEDGKIYVDHTHRMGSYSKSKFTMTKGMPSEWIISNVHPKQNIMPDEEIPLSSKKSLTHNEVMSLVKALPTEGTFSNVTINRHKILLGEDRYAGDANGDVLSCKVIEKADIPDASYTHDVSEDGGYRIIIDTKSNNIMLDDKSKPLNIRPWVGIKYSGYYLVREGYNWGLNSFCPLYKGAKNTTKQFTFYRTSKIFLDPERVYMYEVIITL
jgi:hypothetical protein